jgi:citrate lyase subunit beta/citryl-CoA lyase
LDESIPWRSVLFVPGTSRERFAKAFAAGADAVVLDLEDGVDAARKAEARTMVAEWLTTDSSERAARLVRVNSAGSAFIDDDLEWLASIEGLYDALVLPKVETPEEIVGIARAAAATRIVPLLETARGILRSGDIVTAGPEIPAVLFGAEDLTAELGIPRTIDGDELLVARGQVVLAAASIGADPIDAVFVEIAHADGLRRDATRARALGFTGKMAIHPDQVAVINAVFTPSASEISAARRIVEAAAAAQAEGEGAFRLDGRMVDAPIIRRAERVLSVANRSRV